MSEISTTVRLVAIFSVYEATDSRRQLLFRHSLTHSLVLYRLGIRSALSLLDDVATGSYIITLGSDVYSLATEWLRAYPDQPLTLCDAVLAVLSDRLDLPVWTFDHHFDVIQVAVWR